MSQSDLNFIALDVETANSLPYSICLLGFTVVENGSISGTNTILIDPQCEFSARNIAVHGITPDDVIGAPTFPDILKSITPLFTDQLIIHHSTFDSRHFSATAQHYGVQIPPTLWLDTMNLVRKSLEEYSNSGYGLENLCSDFGIQQIAPHDAADDSRSLAELFPLVLERAGLTISQVLKWKKDRITYPGITQLTRKTKITAVEPKAEPNPQGKYNGQTIVFTGDFPVPRDVLQAQAIQAGFSIRKAVNKTINYLVVGDTETDNVEVFGFKQPSQKPQRAREFNEQGANIQIISMDDFYKLIQ